MVVEYLKIKPVTRGTLKGVATGAAAYRAGETLVDERTGNLYKYAWRKDVSHKEIALPTRFAGDAQLNWARDRSILWNRAEQSERQWNSRVAREYTVVLPSELTHAQRVDLARSFAQALADRHQNAVDFAIHEPRPGRAANHHAHLLATTREVTRTGLGAKTRMEDVMRIGMPWWKHGRVECREVRRVWLEGLGRALREAGKGALVGTARGGAYRGVAAETAPKGWADFDLREVAREDSRATRLTPAERELVKQRKRIIRLKEAAAQALRAAKTREYKRVKAREYYYKNLDSERERSRAQYWKNPDAKRHAARERYHENARESARSRAKTQEKELGRERDNDYGM